MFQIKYTISFLEIEFPGISEFIEVIDIATPKTYVRYTGVKEGAYEGFLPSKREHDEIFEASKASKLLHGRIVAIPGWWSTSFSSNR